MHSNNAHQDFLLQTVEIENISMFCNCCPDHMMTLLNTEYVLLNIDNVMSIDELLQTE